MKYFKDKFLAGKKARNLLIYDLGSSAIGGSYREIFDEKNWKYVGMDIVPGDNVDLVLSDPYNWLEIGSNSVDVLISGQTFEHIEYFWKTILEIRRILKPGGLCCIIAPSSGPEHRYPVDCWRFYPDGFKALARYADLEVLEVKTQWEPEGYIDGSDLWKDTFLVAKKPLCNGKKDEKDDTLHIYQRKIEEDAEDSLSKIIKHISPNSRVLELGPATGYLTRYLSEQMGCLVNCVEKSSEMAQEAGKFCNRMVVGDLDLLNLEEEFEEGSYDYIILADVLEHLKDGKRTLRSCRRLLKKEGHFVLSVPNIAHASIIGGLLQGRFEYSNEGLLDRSHVKFYTRSSLKRALNECGFSIEKIDTVVKLPEDTEFGDSLMNLQVEVQKAIFDAPDSLVYQFVMVCAPLSGPTSDININERSTDSVVELRRLVIRGLMDRIEEAEKELEIAQKLAFERLEYVGKLEKALSEAQQLAHKHMDELLILNGQFEKLQASLQEYEKDIVVRGWRKFKHMCRRKFIQAKL